MSNSAETLYRLCLSKHINRNIFNHENTFKYFLHLHTRLTLSFNSSLAICSIFNKNSACVGAAFRTKLMNFWNCCSTLIKHSSLAISIFFFFSSFFLKSFISLSCFIIFLFKYRTCFTKQTITKVLILKRET